MLANDPDGAEPAEQTANCTFRARRRGDGCVKLDGLLDPLSGAAFLTAFEREDQHLFRQAQDNPDADVHAVEQHSRSTGRRGATALMNLVCRAANRTASTAGEPADQYRHVRARRRRPDPARLADDTGEPLPLKFDDIDQRCEFIDGTPVHPHYVLATLGIATFRRQIMGATGRIIDVSTQRPLLQRLAETSTPRPSPRPMPETRLRRPLRMAPSRSRPPPQPRRTDASR